MRLKLGTRIGIGYGVVIAALMAVLAIAFYAFETARHETDRIRNLLSPSIKATNNLLLALEEIENAEFMYFLPGQDLDRWMQHTDRAHEEFKRWLVKIDDYSYVPEGQELVASIGQNYGAFRHMDLRIRELLRQGRTQEALELNIGDSVELAQQVRIPARAFRDLNLQRIQTAQAQELQMLATSEALAVAVSALAILLAGLIWWRTSRAIVGPLRTLQEAIAQIAEGHFVVSHHPASEQTTEIARLERDFNRMAERRREMAHQLLEANSTLETQVAERTQELERANAELQRSLTELRTLDKLKSDFMAVMSHELLTPINFITGFGSSLEDGVMGPLTPDQERAVKRMLDGAYRLTRMVRNVLDFTNLQSGALSIFPQDLDYEALVKGVMEHFKPQLELKRLGSTLDIQPPLPSVHADPNRVEQVLYELLDNAVKFTSEGGKVRITVRMTEAAVLTEISDTGVGIAPEAIPKLFRGFMQADSSSTRSFGGMGLGLALVKHLVTRMGGTVTVHSQLGQGSTFRFTLPLAV